MRRPVFSELAPVRRRQRWIAALEGAVWGLGATSLAAIGLAVSRGMAGAAVSSTTIWLVLAAGPVIGGLVGLAWRRSWQAAAVAVDTRYALKDRALTALSFTSRPASTPWSQLQVADALTHLSSVVPQRVVPLKAPRAWPWVLGIAVVAVTLIVWPSSAPVVEAGPSEPLPGILAEAEKIDEDLKELAEIAKQEQNKELEKLVEELREKVAEMKEPGVDVKEALAKLSEMQEALQTQAAQYNVAAVDAQMQSLGNALQAAQSLESAGKALAEAKYDKAAEQLENIEEPKLERKEAKALEEKLKKLSEEMADKGMGALSDAASQICEGCKGNGDKMKSGIRTLAKESRNQGRRKKISDLLRSQCDSLSECKCNCQKNSLVKGKKPQKSTSPSSTFGLSTSGNVQGDKTEAAGDLKFEQLTGQEGDGESEVETSHSLEGRQTAARGYKDAYQKYRKLSESVLDSEPIPLGHRQTIRRYFELIRPQQADEPAGGTAEGEK